MSDELKQYTERDLADACIHATTAERERWLSWLSEEREKAEGNVDYLIFRLRKRLEEVGQ